MAFDDLDESVNPYQAPVADLSRPALSGQGSSTTGIDLAVENPWLTIWTRPRETIRGIVNHNPRYRMLAIGMAGGLLISTSALQEAAKSEGAGALLAGFLGGAMMIGVFFLLYIWILGWWLGVVGRWLGGHARTREAQAAVAWGFVPALEAAIPLVLVMLGIFLTVGPIDPKIGAGPAASAAFGIAIFLFMIPAIWGVVVSFKVLGEVHGVSAWRGMATIFLGNFLINLLMMVPALFFMLAIMFGSGRVPGQP